MIGIVNLMIGNKNKLGITRLYNLYQRDMHTVLRHEYHINKEISLEY